MRTATVEAEAKAYIVAQINRVSPTWCLTVVSYDVLPKEGQTMCLYMSPLCATMHDRAVSSCQLHHLTDWPVL
jgi:hypothetical protein